LEDLTLARQMIGLLKRTSGQQQRTLQLLDAQHEAMIARDLTRLAELAGALIGLAEETRQIDQERAALTRQLASVFGVANPADLSLRDIAKRIDDQADAARMLDLRAELLAAQEIIGNRRERNQRLATNILEANDDTLRNLMEALREAGFGPDDTPRFIDRRA
jgi:hypothetical protein